MPHRPLVHQCPLVLIVSMSMLAIDTPARAAGGFELDDFVFLGVWDALTQNWEAQASGCIWSDAGETLYQVRAEGLNDTTSNFRLSNEVGNRVDLNVHWNDQSTDTGRERLLPNQLSDTYPIDPLPDCGGTANLWITLSVDALDMDLAPQGIYSDSLLFTLDPL